MSQMPNHDEEFEKLRFAFLEEMSDRLLIIENLLMEVEVEKQLERKRRLLIESMSKIHSLKGAAGAHEFPWIVTACHRVEDQLVKIQSAAAVPSQEAVARILPFPDVLTAYAKAYRSGKGIDEEKFNSALEKLISPGSAAAPAAGAAKAPDAKVLFVGKSEIFMRHVLSWFDKNNIGHLVSVAKDSHEALGRLCHERFDIVITSLFVAPFTGTELISMVKTLPRLSGVKTVLMTSEELKGAKGPHSPDFVVKKDEKFLTSVTEVLKQLIHATPVQAAAPTQMANRQLKSVIYLDDDEDVLRLAHAAFRRDPSISFQMFSDGELALAAISQNPPDLVISDVQMPKVDGYEVLKRLKADPKMATVPILFVTTEPQSPDAQGLIAGGALGLIDKTIGILAVVNKVKELWASAHPASK